jgi:hypothetical protein
VWGFWERNDEKTNAFGGGSFHTYWDYSGTSHAAAQVAGLAGLLKSFRPQLTNGEIKDTIIDQCILMSSLYQKCKSGGRVSAERVLNYQKFFGQFQTTTTELGLEQVIMEAQDNNPIAGIFRGTVTLYNIPPGFDMTAVDMRFADVENQPLEPKPRIVQPDLSEFSLVVTVLDSIIPDKADKIRICPMSASGLVGDLENQCAFMLLAGVDVGRPSKEPRVVSLVKSDDDTRLDQAHVRISWRAAEPEQDMSSYRIYQVYKDSLGNFQKVPNQGHLAEVQKIGYVQPTLSGKDKSKISLTKGEGETWVVSRQNYGNNERATITLSGMADITFTLLTWRRTTIS